MFFKKFLRKNESGQVLVEAAIVMPLMIFFTLGIVQMTMMQQAKIMVDYSAYAAARSGVVNNVNMDSMTAAANIAILPVYARTNNLRSLARAYLMYTIGTLIGEKMEDIFGSLPQIPVVTTTAQGQLDAFMRNTLGLTTFGFATVVVVNPLHSDFTNIEAVSADTGKVSSADDFDNLNDTISKQRTARGITNREKNVLTVAVSFNYELKIPFANWVIFETWSATQVGLELTGAIWSSRVKVGGLAGMVTGNSNATGGGGMVSRQFTRNALLLKSTFGNDGNPLRVFQKIRTPLERLWTLNSAGLYIIPIYGSYSMRMHSNVYKSNLSEKVETLLMTD